MIYYDDRDFYNLFKHKLKTNFLRHVSALGSRQSVNNNDDNDNNNNNNDDDDNNNNNDDDNTLCHLKPPAIFSSAAYTVLLHTGQLLGISELLLTSCMAELELELELEL